MTGKKLANLQMLAQLGQEIELARLAKLAQQQTDLREQQRALRAGLGAQEGAGLSDPATLGKYLDWVQGQCAALARQEAALAPEIAQQRAAAAKAFGRNEALEKLAARQATKGRRQPLS